MVTMSDVAREAGVSVMTVSNVLAGRRGVGAPTRHRVLDAVEALGYEMHLTARNLRSGRTDTVALVAPSFHDYYSELADQIAPLVEAEGRHLVLERTSASAQSEIDSLSITRVRLYDGVLLSVAGLDREHLDQVRTRAPLVLLGEREVPARFDHVSLNNEDGARLATAHMLAGGARRVLALGCTLDTRAGMPYARQVGWAQAHQESGLSPDPSLVVPLPTYSTQAAHDTVRDLLASGVSFDAVFAVTDMIAFGAMAAVTEGGLTIPGEVQVAGYDNVSLAQFVPPGLTSIDPDHAAVARTAVKLLERRMRGAADPPEHVITPVQLVVRGSTRPSA